MGSKQRETERRFVSTEARPLEVRAAADGGPTELAGYASVFEQWSEIRDIWGASWMESVARGAYAKTIGEADVRALFNHNPDVVLGRNRAGTLELSEDATGLRDVIRPPDNAWGRPVLDAVQRGDITGQSIAFQVIKERWERPAARGELAKRTILEARLVDVSVVTFPAFEQTSVQARAMGSEDEGNGAALGLALQLARLAAHGYPLDADERARVGLAVAILRRWAGEPGTVAAVNHSSEPGGSEPGARDGRADYSVAYWRDRLALMQREFTTGRKE